VRLTYPNPLLFHAEVVYRDGVAVGDIRSASYGHTLGGAVGLCMVRAPEQGGGVTAQWVLLGARGKSTLQERGTLRWPRSDPCMIPGNDRIRGTGTPSQAGTASGSA